MIPKDFEIQRKDFSKIFNKKLRLAETEPIFEESESWNDRGWMHLIEAENTSERKSEEF